MRRLLYILMVLCPLTVSADKFDYLYLEAVRQMDMEHYDKAYELLLRCNEMKPEAAEVNYKLGLLDLAMGLDSIGVSHITRAAELAPDNTEFVERLAQTYLYRNDIESATKVYERLVACVPDRTDILEMLTRIYEQQHDYANLLKTLNRIELQEGQSEELTLSKMQAYSFMGNQQGAYNELKGLIDSHPNDLNLQVMMGNWLLTNGKKQEALQTFTKVLREEPANISAQTSLMDYYRATGEEAKADSLRDGLINNPRADDDTRVTLLYQWIKAAPKDSIRGALEKILSIKPEDIKARLDLIEIMWADTVDMNVVRECEKAVEYVPNQPALYYYLGVAQYLNEMNEDAILSLRLGAANIDRDTSRKLCSDIYLMLGDIYHKIGDKKGAYEAYDSCLVYDPDRVLCLNNYAYFLSLDKYKLDKAENMSLKAITAEPDNGTYLDTYAWILYQEGRYEEAKKYIDMAMEALEKKHKELLDGAEDNRTAVEKACQEETEEVVEHLKAINEKIKTKHE